MEKNILTIEEQYFLKALVLMYKWEDEPQPRTMWDVIYDTVAIAFTICIIAVFTSMWYYK